MHAYSKPHRFLIFHRIGLKIWLESLRVCCNTSFEWEMFTVNKLMTFFFFLPQQRIFNFKKKFKLPRVYFCCNQILTLCSMNQLLSLIHFSKWKTFPLGKTWFIVIEFVNILQQLMNTCCKLYLGFWHPQDKSHPDTQKNKRLMRLWIYIQGIPARMKLSLEGQTSAVWEDPR